MVYSRIDILVVDDTQMYRDMLTVGMSREPSIRVKSIEGNAANFFNIQDIDISKFAFIILGESGVDKHSVDALIERVLKKDVQIAVLADYATSNEVKSKSAVLKRPKLNDREGFERAVSELVAFITKEPVKVNVSNFSASTKKSLFSNEIYSKLKEIADKKISNKTLNDYIIAIGSSTGGTEALRMILLNLPIKLPPIVIVQHMPPVFTKMYADRMNEECALNVKEAETGDLLRPGTVFIAPGDKHMRVVKSGTRYIIECEGQEKVGGHCPAVNVLFESVTDVFAANAFGVILTGMGRDGAEMLLRMRQKGARTIGQDEESSVVYGMPKVAFEIGAVERQLPIAQIATELVIMLSEIK